MEEQTRLSQLELDYDGESPRWSTDDWPRLLDGWRYGHASIVVGEGNKESIIVLGGDTGNGSTNSVLVMNTTEKQFRKGPSLCERRGYLAVKKANTGVYACGGSSNGNSFGEGSFDTIERIDVNDLLETPASSTACKWKTLPCRLTTPRVGCSACDVMNRYLVIAGGFNSTRKWLSSVDIKTYLSSVDILDTGGDGNHHTIVAGIDMNRARSLATSEVIGTRMFVVGGQGHHHQNLRSVEYVELGCNDNSDNASTVFQTNFCWTLANTLALSKDAAWNAMVKIEKCLIVAGGHLCSVEVLDTDRHVVWSLPSMTRERIGCSMVALSKSIVCIGGFHRDSVESLSIHLSRREHLKAICKNRAELEAEIDKLTTAIHRASVESTSVQILQEGSEAEALIPILKSLRSDDKFCTADDIQDQIDELTMELEQVHSAKERIPIVKQINDRKNLLAQSGQIPENDKATAQRGASLANLAPLPEPDSFYVKLVEASDDPMTGKVHELSVLVLHVYHFKVFYSFLNHLCRSGLISAEHRRRYTGKALKVITKTITKSPVQEQDMFESILVKAVEDGALSESDSEEIKRHKKTVGSTQQPAHETDIRHHLAAMHFRVGNVHCPPIDAIKPPSSNNAEDQKHEKNCIFSEVQVLGWSLNQLKTAFLKGRHEEVAVAAICSILNACRFGASVQDGTRERNNTDEPIAPTPLILPRIVDFGDVHHIGHVAKQSGLLPAQRAFAEGIALVDGAMAAAKQNVMTASAVTNLVQDLNTGSLSSSEVLAAVMGKFANAVSQWYKKYDGNCGSNEEVTILALAVTAKLVQASESKFITPSVSNFDSSADDWCSLSKSECQKGKDCSLFHGTGRASAATLCNTLSNIIVSAPAVSNQQPRSILARVERLESTMGNCVPLVQRISALEEYCGLDGTGMTLADRLSKLEDHVFKDP